MNTKRLILMALLVGMVSGCDLFGGDGGSDDPYVPPADTPPADTPPAQPPIELLPVIEQVLYEPPLADAPVGDPASVVSYRVDPIGLVDEGYNSAYDLNDSGQVVGESDGEGAGDEKVWLYSGGTTRVIGLSNSFAPPEFSDHYGGTEPIEINEQGQVIGWTFDLWELGESAVDGHPERISFNIGWLYSSGETISLGLPGSYGADRGTGSEVAGLNEAGEVTGITWMGNSELSWFYSDGDYRIIHPTDQEHTSEDGEQNSSPEAINETGDVLGWSERYLGPIPGGSSCWLYRDGTTYQIGLLDQEHSEVSTGERECLPNPA